MRADRTALEKLVDDIGLCTPNRICSYHQTKRDNIPLSLPPLQRHDHLKHGTLVPSEPVIRTLDAMTSKYQVSGSWPLVAEERDWLLSKLRNTLDGMTSPAVITIFGIAGVQHFIDTLSIIEQAGVGPVGFLVQVIDRCSTPLVDIDKYWRSKYENAGTNISLHLIHDNIASLDFAACDLSDIGLCHYLFRFLDENSAAECIAAIHGNLRPASGRLLLAQDHAEYMPEHVAAYFVQFGFRLVSESVSWGPYKLSRQAIERLLAGYPVDVAMDCALLELSALS